MAGFHVDWLVSVKVCPAVGSLYQITTKGCPAVVSLHDLATEGAQYS